jgi:hypothetical protein
MESCDAMGDDELLRLFERGTLPCGAFRHRDHVRVAWLLLRGQPFEEAALRFVVAIKRLAATSGAPMKYHQTITWAYLALIDERLAATGAAELSFACFLEQNPDLVDREHSALARLYDRQLLESELARRAFVLPRA